jgi:hypothetical protein
MKPLVRLNRCNSRRWFARRLHCRDGLTAWRDRPMLAGFRVRAGWWLLTVGLLGARR